MREILPGATRICVKTTLRIIVRDNTTQGKKLMDVYMKKDKSAVKTGGWVYAAFGPDRKAKAIDPVKDCFDCHAAGAKDTDYVFHKYID